MPQACERYGNSEEGHGATAPRGQELVGQDGVIVMVRTQE